MDVALLMSIALKGVSVIEFMVQHKQDIVPMATMLKNLFTKAPADITDADLDAIETMLDAKLDEFLKPMHKTPKG